MKPDYQCYYLQMMREDTNVSNATQESVEKTWQRINCNDGLACQAAVVTPPDFCPNQQEAGGRGGGGGSTGGSGGGSAGGSAAGSAGGSAGGSVGGSVGGTAGSSVIGGSAGSAKGSRKKRQISGGRRGGGGSRVPGTGGEPDSPPDGGPPSGPHPQTPNADANAYAEFLVKYMDLDDDTRRNIGHKVPRLIMIHRLQVKLKEDENISKLTTTLMQAGA